MSTNTEEVLKQVAQNLEASRGDTVVRNSNEGQPKDGAPELVATDESRVNPVSKDVEPSAQPGKPSLNMRPANPSVSHVQNDRPNSGEEKSVAQQFYTLTPAEVCDVAFTGLTTLNPMFKSTWISPCRPRWARRAAPRDGP